MSAPAGVPWCWLAWTPVLAVSVALVSAPLPGLRAVRQGFAESVRHEQGAAVILVAAMMQADSMGSARTPALLALALALCAIALFLALGSGDSGAPTGTGALEKAQSDGAAGAVEASVDAVRQPVGGPTETAARDGAEEPPAPGASLPLTGVVVDAAETPIGGARVTVVEELGAGFNMLAERRSAETRASTVTGGNGTFALSVPFARHLLLRVEADGFARADVDPCYAGEHHVVVLQRGATLEGRVTDAATGDPVADVVLEGWLAGSGRADLLAGESAADGTFRFEDLPPGILMVDATPREHENLLRREVELRAGETSRLDLELQRGGAVFGTVTDSDTGQPIAGAEISAGWTFEKVVRSDAAGHYRMQGAPGPGVSEMYARAAGYAQATHEARVDAGFQGELQLDFALRRAGSVRGRVIDRDGVPQTGVYVAADADLGVVHGMGRSDWQHTRTGGDGLFRIRGLVPGAEYTLFVRHPGRATLALLLPGKIDPNRELDAGDLVLEEPAVLLGRVVDRQGNAIAGAGVDLGGTNADRDRLLGAAERGQRMVPYHAGNRDTRTDEEGRFRFADLAEGTYDLSISIRGGPSGERKGVWVAAGRTTADVEIVIDLGAVLSGKVVTEDGSPLPPLVSVQIDPVGDEQGSSRWVMPGRDGTFRALGLQEGRYRLEAQISRWANDEPPPWFGGALEDVEAGREDLQLVLYRVDHVSGRVVDADGRPRRGIVVLAVQTEAEGHTARDITDEAGRFRVRVRRGTIIDLRYGVAPEEMFPGLVLEPNPETAGLYRGARAGATELVLELR